MPKPRLYAIDTSSLSALHENYPRKNFSSVWDLMDTLVSRGQLTSVEDVLIELREGPESSFEWAKKHREIFWPLSAEIQQGAREILRSFPKLVDMKRPSSSADAFLIARARLCRGTVVTEENRSGGASKQKIPDVCGALSVRCIKLLDLLQLEKLS